MKDIEWFLTDDLKPPWQMKLCKVCKACLEIATGIPLFFGFFSVVGDWLNIKNIFICD